MPDPADTDVLDKPKADTTTPIATPDEIKPPAGTTPTPRLLTPERIERFGAAADEALRTSGEAQTKIAESAGREADILRHRAETQAPARKEVVSAIDEELRTRREHPPQPPAELPERPKLRYDLHEIMGPPGSNKPMNQWMNQIGVLAAISGRTPQERMLLAVTAFNGMIEGWAKGKQEDFQQRYNEWKDQVETIRDTETRKRQYIQDVLNDAKASTELKSLKLQVLGQEDGDRLLVEAAVQKQWQAIDKGNEEKFKLVENVVKTAESIDKALQLQTRDFSDAALKQRVDMMLQGMPAAQYQRGIRAGSTDEARFSQMAAEEQARQGISAEDLVQRQAEYAGRISAGRATATAPVSAVTATLRQLEQNRAAIDQAEQTALANLDVLMDRTRAADRTGVPVIERLRREGARALGDDRVYAFYTALKIVEPEVARILVNPRLVGQLTDSARREAQTFMDTGMSLSNLVAVRKVLITDFANRRNANQQQLKNEVERLHTGLSAPDAPLATESVPEIAPYVAPGPPASIGTYEEWRRSLGK